MQKHEKFMNEQQTQTADTICTCNKEIEQRTNVRNPTQKSAVCIHFYTQPGTVFESACMRSCVHVATRECMRLGIHYCPITYH